MEMKVLESLDNCTYSYSDPVGNDSGVCECSVQTCADGTEAAMVDCTLLGGDVLDLCQSEPAVDGTMFEHRSFKNCIDFSPENDVCSDSDEALLIDGSIITGSLVDAMYYDAASCANPSSSVGLWCK